MCGIYGVVWWDRRVDPDRAAVEAATDHMADRGPDGRGVLIRPGLALGHRRLAIVDVAHGAQPMCSADGRLALVYNGEIYNHDALRRELKALGRTFRTRCDTEVVLAAHEAWGSAAVTRLRGMFAYALVDLTARRTWLVRDRMGVKPLYYALLPDRLVFASELRPIVETEGIDRAVDVPVLSHYLSTLQPCLGERTLYRAIRLLAPGHALCVEPGGATKRTRYWDIPVRRALDTSPEDGAGEPRHVQDTLERVADAVACHLPADRPVGCFLSGGLDSSVIIGLMHALTGARPPAGTVGFVQPAFHEFPFARAVAADHAAHLEEVLVDDAEFFALLPALVHRRAAPLTTPNEVPMYCLSRRIRDRFPVALTGEGADEVFAGYGAAYRAAHDLERAAALAAGGGGFTPLERDDVSRALRAIYGTDRFDGPVDHYLSLLQWVPLAEKRALLNDRTLDAVRDDADTVAHYEGLFDHVRDAGAYDQLLYVHARANLHGLLLRVDSATMAASVEARVPFCDAEVVEAAFAMPYAYKLRWRSPEAAWAARTLPLDEIAGHLDETKYVMRRAFEFLVGPDVVARPKRSFPVPIDEWLRGRFRFPAAQCILGCDALREWFRPAALERIVRGNDPRTAYRMWPLLNLALWLDTCAVTP